VSLRWPAGTSGALWPYQRPSALAILAFALLLAIVLR
jgi:hypothetical protein